MARLPQLPAERPTPQPTARVVGYRTPGALGPVMAPDLSAVGQSLVGVGAETRRAGEQIYQAQQVEKEKQDVRFAEDALNRLRGHQFDLTYTEGKGFLHRKGSDAAKGDLFKDYGVLFGEQERQIEAQLANEEQRALFRKRSGMLRQQFQEGLTRHIAHERDVFAKQVYEGTLATETRAATAGWNDPAAIAVSLERINAAIRDEAARSGWAPEAAEAARLQASGKVHSAVVGQMLATDNLIAAERYYNANKDSIDPATAKAVQKAVEDGTQKQVFNAYNGAFLTARNDRRALSGLEAAVLKDEKLDEGRKNVLLGRIQSRGEVLENRAQRERDRWEKNMERQINAVNAITLAGYEPTAEQMAPLITATKGTALEGQVRQMIQTANTTRAFRNAPPAQQEAFLAAAEAQARKDPTKTDINALGRMRTIYNAQREQVREDPINFAVRQGFAETVPLDISRPAGAATAIASRAQIARDMRARYQAPFQLLTREEATLLSSALKDASPKQKQEYFAGLATATTGDRDAYKAIMAQLAPDDPVTAQAGIYASGASQQRRTASEFMIRGQALLNPPKKEDGKPAGGRLVAMPPDAELQRDFTDHTEKVFAGNPGAANGYLQAAKAIYAARSADAGDTSGKLDARRWRESIELATGKVETYRGKPIILPENYDMQRFRDALSSHVQGVTASGRLDPAVTRQRLLDMPLENVGDGRYVFRSGDGVLVDKSNAPIVIQFR